MARPNFAVAAKAFDKPSETFIRMHAEAIVPDRTVLLTSEQAEATPNTLIRPTLWQFGTLENNWLVRKGFRRNRVLRFLAEHRVGTVLAEYGNVGTKLLPHIASSNIRLFVHFHGYDATKGLRTPKQVAAHRDLFETAAGFFAPSRFIKDKLVQAGCSAEKISVVPCGVDADSFPPSVRKPGRILAVGRFVAKKAPLTLLKSFGKAAAKVPNLHLDYIGSGDLLDAAKTQAAADGLQDRVTFHGAQPHGFVREKLSEAAIFIQHSVTGPDTDSEGLPVAIMEAMAAGVPVVSTRHSGIPEAVVEGKTGLLVDEHDADGMADAIVKYAVAERADMDRIAAAARDRIRDGFTSEQAIEALRNAMGL